MGQAIFNHLAVPFISNVMISRVLPSESNLAAGFQQISYIHYMAGITNLRRSFSTPGDAPGLVMDLFDLTTSPDYITT
jgi:hypothetical protein